MFDELKKYPNRTGWKLITEWCTHAVYKSNAGDWYRKWENGGWGGSYGPGHPDKVESIYKADAFELLTEWGLDEESLNKYFPDFMPALDK